MALVELPASHAPVGSAPPAPPARPRVVAVGTALVSAGILMAFATMLGMYLQKRAGFMAANPDATWVPEAVTFPMHQPNVMVLALLMSSVVIQWAVWAIRNNDRPQAYLALGITELFGFAVVNLAAYNYSIMKLDIDSGSELAIMTYAITGGHLLLLVAAMIFTALMAFRALGGQFSSRQYDGMTAAAMFWHVQVLVFAVIWYAIYITK